MMLIDPRRIIVVKDEGDDNPMVCGGYVVLVFDPVCIFGPFKDVLEASDYAIKYEVPLDNMVVMPMLDIKPELKHLTLEEMEAAFPRACGGLETLEKIEAKASKDAETDSKGDTPHGRTRYPGFSKE